MGVDFAGTSTGIRYGNGSRLILANVPGATASFWVNGLVLTGDPGFFDITNPSGGSRFQVQWLTGDAKLWVGGRSADGDSFKYVYSTANALTSSLHHVCAVLDYTNDDIHVYIDGVLDNSALNVGFGQTSTSNTAPQDADIGCVDALSDSLDASLYDFRLYKRALTAAEIQTIHASAGRDVIIADLEMWLKFKEAAPGTAISTSLVKDYSVNNWTALSVSGTTKNYVADIISVR